MKWFRVLYPDDRISELMTLGVALDYRAIFGGRLLLEIGGERLPMSVKR